jgi:membrane-bound inhibitor of C-type lysozyme
MMRSFVIVMFVVAALSHVAHAQTNIINAHYKCESGRQIAVRYDNTKPAAATALLTFGGRNFNLYQVMSASGARYATEQGLRPDFGLQWWIKGNEATLSEMMMDHTAPQPKQIDKCSVVKGR